MKQNWKKKLPRAITPAQLRAVRNPKEKLLLVSPYDLKSERSKCRRLGLPAKIAFVWREGMGIAFRTLSESLLKDADFQAGVASDGTVMCSSNLGTKLGEMIGEASDLKRRALKQYRLWCKESKLIRRFDPHDKKRIKYDEFCRSILGPNPQARFLNFGLEWSSRMVAVCLVIDESRVWREQEVRDSLRDGFRHLQEPGPSHSWAPDMQFTDLADYHELWRTEGLSAMLPKHSFIAESEKWWGSAAYQLIEVAQVYCRACEVVPGFQVAWKNLSNSKSSPDAALQIAIPLAYCKCVLVGFLEALGKKTAREPIRFTKQLDVALEAGKMLSRAQILIEAQAITRLRAEQGKGGRQGWFWPWVFSCVARNEKQRAKDIFNSLDKICCPHLQGKKFKIDGDILLNPDGTERMKYSSFAATYSKLKHSWFNRKGT